MEDDAAILKYKVEQWKARGTQVMVFCEIQKIVEMKEVKYRTYFLKKEKL